MLVAVRPLGPQGASPTPAEVAADYVELRVDHWRTGCEQPSPWAPEGTPDGAPCTDGLVQTQGERCLAHECLAP